ncbi:MAG TPA: GC-type dockerin domain-anchored protein [Phycisphaerales bacterium]|nr:GC-type dockerin domain-anchored protein [Phycisphaerales bacterium]
MIPRTPVDRQPLPAARTIAACALAAGLAWRCPAQADFAESFDDVGPVNPGQDGPSGLIAEGWIFRNQSQPEGPGTWHQGRESLDFFQPHEGTGYLGVHADVAGYGGIASDWAILPVVPGQSAGDIVTFFVRGYPYFQGNNEIQLRYSPSGATGTGSGATDVGDFTVLLSTSFPENWEWEPVTAVLPGGGRLAIRYYKNRAYDDGDMYIDTLTVGGDVDPPLPGPGETVHWTPDMSPVRITHNLTIVEGGTVIVDPGVEVRVGAEAALRVEGSFVTDGTPASRVRLNGEANTARIDTAGGVLDIDYTDVNVQMGVADFNAEGHAGDGRFTHCTFLDFGLINGSWEFTHVEDSVYRALYPAYLFGAVRAVNVDSAQTIVLANGVYVLDNVVVNGATGSSMLDGAGFWLSPGIQSTYLTGASAVNNAQAGIYLANGNTLIGADNVIQGNKYAVECAAGLLPGSVIPPTGNTFNGFISVGHGSQLRQITGATNPNMIWADVGFPYIVGAFGRAGPGLGQSLTILPGVNVKMGRGSFMSTSEFGALRIQGSPGEPIVIEALTSGQRWDEIQFATSGNRMSDVVVSGSEYGIASYLGVVVDVQNSVVRDNFYGGLRGVRAEKTQFLNNAVGVSNALGDLGSGVPQLDPPPENGNSFDGNGIGVEDAFAGQHFEIQAQNNWWGHPSGPDSWDNPGGQGDSTKGFVYAVPFLAEKPDFENHAPIVRVKPHSLLEPGSKVMLQWESEDDQGVVSHAVYYSPNSNGHEGGFILIADNLPGTQRELEWIVPDVGYNIYETYIRVVAYDPSGQRGWDEFQTVIPDGGRPGQITIQNDPGGRTYRAGDRVDFDFTAGGFDDFFSGTVDIWLVLENDDHWEYLSSGDFSGVHYSNLDLPCVSTDAARFAVVATGSLNIRKHFFTEPFGIRPDARIGDQPPQVELLSPSAGQSFAAGGVAPITWSASDDEALRSFKIYASYDAGRTWQRIATDLPASARSFTWRLAPGEGFDDVRVKVVAIDSRFQNSSDGRDASFSVTPGSGCIADFNGDGDIDTRDVLAFLNAWNANDPQSDANGDGVIDTRDVLAFLNLWNAGC